jgi:hypothetical protein
MADSKQPNGDPWAPPAPASVTETSIDPEILRELVLKTAHTVIHFTTEWMIERLCLPAHIVAALLDEMKRDRSIEALGTAGAFGYRYSITDRGRERAVRLFEISSYVGPAPVSIDAYTSLLEWQIERLPRVTPQRIEGALSELVLPPHVGEMVGLAASSGRSLFVHGPPGNGKTSLGHLIHDALDGVLWVPYCVGVGNDMIRIFDPQCHDAAPLDRGELERPIDRRWVRIRRPLVVVAGELTLEALDLTFSGARGYYEAPTHVKANGGAFLLDDFGRQRVDPKQLLNRWVFPLEHGYDYLTLRSSQKIAMPFRQMLIICTNLDPNEVMDPAFLRRMGYRLYLGNPTAEAYSDIFERYAAKRGIALPAGVMAMVTNRYAAEGRPLRSCEPRDLIERMRDFCSFHGRPVEICEDVFDIAWKGYFGEKDRQLRKNCD